MWCRTVRLAANQTVSITFLAFPVVFQQSLWIVIHRFRYLMASHHVQPE